MRVVGQSVTRSDSLPQVLGQIKYIDDLSFPGMVYAKILRSHHPHARILDIDTRKADALPGVFATLTAKDIPVNTFGPTFQDQPVLAGDKVRHMGDGVAAVAAVNEKRANDALSKITVTYDPLPAVFDPLEAMDENAPKVHDPKSNIYSKWHIEKGDAEKGLERAHVRLKERYVTQMVEHVPMEPHAAIACWDSFGRLTVWSTLGRISLARSDIARVLDIPINKVRVISTQVGGNFGGKNEITMEPIAALLAKKCGRPVKAVFSREDEFVSSTTRHPFIMDYVTGVSSTGRILARKIRLVCDGGAYCSWSETTLGKASILSSGPYRINDLMIDGYAVYTNNTMTGAMRGFGAPQVCFAYESHMDSIAHKLGMDPLDIRMANAFEENSISPTGQILKSVAIKKTLEAAARQFNWGERIK
jgi:CO/xanthine dehydrogenase Mo-binding subunit